MAEEKHPQKPPTKIDENSQRGSYGESVRETPLNITDTVPPPPPPDNGGNHESEGSE